MTRLLNPGDTIAIVSPSITLSRRESINLDAAIGYFENLGFKIKLMPTTLTGLRHTPDSDQEKARDIMAAFAAPEVKAIVAAHGGASSLRTLPFLDFNVIRAHPKPLIGFSDTTSVQLGIYAQAKLPYISGFLCEYDFRRGNIDPMVDRDLRAVLDGEQFFSEEGSCLRGGNAEATLVGGNLSTLSDLNGTPYYPDIRDSIILIEDEMEKTYKIALMLTQLRLNPDFKYVKGIVFGKFSECEDPGTTHGNLDDVISDFARLIDVPVIRDFAYGHFPARHVLTLGVRYRLNADDCTLEQIG